MKTNNDQGRTYVIIIGAYLVVKAVLNMFLGGHLNLSDYLFAAVASFAMLTGLQYMNIVVSGFLALGIFTHLLYNVTHLPSTIPYLLEALLDIAAIVVLLVQSDVKEHFTYKWEEIGELFKKE